MHDAVAEQDFARHEHRELVPWFDRIHEVGAAVGHLSAGELSVALHRIVVWLEHDLEDHAAWEETWLYPEVDSRVGTPWATRTMRYGHQQIRAAIRQLSAEQAALAHELSPSRTTELRSRIFGLEAVLRAHMECEDRVLLPLLDDDGPERSSPTH
jgi:iron-sulfur cluster repair protein YtfE (RIC family)